MPYREQIQAAFGHHDISHIEAHVDAAAGAAVRSMGAEAIASGTHVAFAGTPSLFTAAHEAAHVIQQAAGVDVAGGVGRDGDRYERHADEVAERVVRGRSAVDLLDAFVELPHRAPSPREPVREPRTGEPPARSAAPTTRRAPSPASRTASPVQLRRIPPNVEALLTATGGGADGVNFDAHAAGVERLIERAMAELTPAQRTTVLANRRGALTEATFLALPRRERLSRHGRAIIAVVSTLELGDPALMNTAPTGVAATSLNTLVTNANTRFDEIAAGTHDAHIDSVFGLADPRVDSSITNRPGRQTARGVAVELGLSDLLPDLDRHAAARSGADQLSAGDDFVERSYEHPPPTFIHPEPDPGP